MFPYEDQWPHMTEEKGFRFAHLSSEVAPTTKQLAQMAKRAAIRQRFAAVKFEPPKIAVKITPRMKRRKDTEKQAASYRMFEALLPGLMETNYEDYVILGDSKIHGIFPEIGDAVEWATNNVEEPWTLQWVKEPLVMYDRPGGIPGNYSHPDGRDYFKKNPLKPEPQGD